ncbi:MAG: 3-methyl-2-oxobutanoate hydroxymethyltransferase [Candidatus Margulisbacteria bacterium]|nr:3-methyl-2-oxobutanoate hydroxymethyltransferase [Candidatus Margulisiibacteriota bacterium]
MITIKYLQNKKAEGEKFAALTAYDYLTARVIDEAGVELILVGDTLGVVVYGYESTVYVTMDDMVRHTKAVANGIKNSLLISDMPFMSYHTSLKDTLINAGLLIKAGAKGVKAEGATPFVLKSISRMVEAGILVIGHIGFTPQQINRIGGNIIQGKSKDMAEKLKEDALKLQDAGVGALVLELIPESLGKEITSNLTIPTIGIGAGRYCDGQILVTHDLLGLYTDFTPKFLKRYANLNTTIKNAVAVYRKDVLSGKFPTKDNIY